MYKLEELIVKFIDHAHRAKENEKQLIAQFIENNLGQELPDHFKDDFNLPLALASMCHELLLIKNRMPNKIEL